MASFENVDGKHFAFVGVGVMGGAILSAFFEGAGVEPSAVTIVAENETAAAHLAARFRGVEIMEDALAAVEKSDVMVLAVKPKDVEHVLTSVQAAFVPQLEAGHDEAQHKMVLTVAAGLPTSFYERRLGPVPVVRAMPNTPAQIGLGMTAISAGSYAHEGDMALARAILQGSGEVIDVAEKDQDAVSAISGSGPAYAFAVIDAMAEAGVMLGLTRATSVKLAAQTLLGASQMVLDGQSASPQLPPSTLREQVTSPGGTTAQALFELDKAGVRAAFIAAAQAAWKKSSELGSASE